MIRMVALALAGCMQALSLAWPVAFEIKLLGLTAGHSVWWLQIGALAVLAGSLIHANSLKQAAWHSWVFSTAWLCGTIWWLYISMHTYGGLPSWLAAFAVLLLSGCLALFYMLVCLIFHQITTKSIKKHKNCRFYGNGDKY